MGAKKEYWRVVTMVVGKVASMVDAKDFCWAALLAYE